MSARGTGSVGEDFPFLRAIFCRPDDDGLRLVYADWLEERGDPRADFLRWDVVRNGQANTGPTHMAAEVGAWAQRLDRHWVTRMWQTRNLSPGVRLDLASVAAGKGLIDVRGGQGGETGLLVEGRPIALNWDDCQGSIGQYLVFTGHRRGRDF